MSDENDQHRMTTTKTPTLRTVGAAEGVQLLVSKKMGKFISMLFYA